MPIEKAELARDAEDLAQAILRAMKEWGDGGTRDAAVPLTALVVVAETCLRQMPPQRRAQWTIDFANSLIRRMDIPAKVIDSRS